MKKTTKNIIRDGQTRRGRIDEEPGLHEGLAFEYRPSLPEEVEQIESAAQKEKPKDGVRLIAAYMAERLVEWSESDGDPSFENVRRLPFDLFNKLYKVLVGMRATDPIEEPTKDEEDEEIAALRAQAEGKDPGREAAETSEGN